MTKQSQIDSCQYHHQQQPSWICTGCNTALCQQCIPYGHSSYWGRTGPRCPLCNRGLAFRHATVDTPPFWKMLPHFFTYPLHVNSLSMIAMLAFASIVLPYLSFLAIFIGLFLLAITVKYSFQIIEYRAQNQEAPPSIGELFRSDQQHLFFKMLAVIVILYGGSYVLSADSVALYNVLNGIITFLLPALTIILAMEKSVRTTLNPLVILSFILRIGWAYLLVWFCYQIVSSGPLMMMALLPENFSMAVALPIIVTISLYFWFTANCMLGYTVYQYQGSLGNLQGMTKANDDDVSKDSFDKARTLAEAYIAVREGRLGSARQQLRPLLDRFKHDIACHDDYHKVLILLDDKEATENHAHYYLQFLVDGGQFKKAATVYHETLSALPQYQPDNVNIAYQVARVIYGNGNKQHVAKLLNNLHKVSDRDPVLPMAYLLLAKVYSEYFNQDKQAIKIIEFILDRFPRAENRTALLQYRKLLLSMVA